MMVYSPLPTPTGLSDEHSLTFDAFRGPTPNGQMSGYARKTGVALNGLPTRGWAYQLPSRGAVISEPRDFTKLQSPQLEKFIKL